jgi:hypothetical protein
LLSSNDCAKATIQLAVGVKPHNFFQQKTNCCRFNFFSAAFFSQQQISFVVDAIVEMSASF